MHACMLAQFIESGCDNCPWLELEEEPAKVQDCTTGNFSGYDLEGESYKSASENCACVLIIDFLALQQMIVM
eukprot:scaffold85296_cov19-Tisochrysis_lutea.AAC.2